MPAFHSHSGTDSGVQEPWEQDQKHLDTGDKPSATELADELFDWLDKLDMDTFGKEEDMKLGEMLDALDAATSDDDDSFDVEASLAAFHREHQDLFKRQNAAHTSFWKRSKLRIALPMAAMLVIVMGSLTAQALGVDVFGAVARWTSEIFHFTDSSIPYAMIQTVPLAEGETKNYDTLQDAVDDFGIDVPLAPSWVPDRFVLSEVIAENISSGILIYAAYNASDGFLRISFNESSKDIYGSLEKDLSTAKAIDISNILHFIVTDQGITKAVWQNGELECHVSGNVTMLEMEQIINSIYEVVKE